MATDCDEWLEQYDKVDIIGNGSFGVILKVRRKADGKIFARKDLNFSLMTDRDKRQIVAEVNILKDLHHENIVRYYDRMVDRDKGTLHILMEYCGGGDLSSLIKRAAREAEKANLPPRGLDEERVWNILMQLLKALVYCHHPNAIPSTGSTNGHTPGHSRSPSLNGSDGEGRRAQILHRDLKPDNVFLDENDTIKLGDFGLSKALLDQASFANTYVGTPYYMSPELMQEKAYDNKSDIWSLGCLVYELCALKPPFHEARTHAELAQFIKNGRIPPLPRGYSSTLSSTIKAMLNLNPAMRPSAIQLMQHERIDYAVKLDEITSAIANLKTHKEQVVQRERALIAREQAFSQRDVDIIALQQTLANTQEQVILAHAQIAQLQVALQEAQSQIDSRPASPADYTAVLAAKEAEFAERAALRDVEVNQAWEAREKELLHAVRARELELESAWRGREEGIMAHAKATAEAHTTAQREREAEVMDAWERREEEVRKRWEEMEAELEARVKAREVEVERAWETRERDLQREADQRVKEAVERALQGAGKDLSGVDSSFDDWQSAGDISGVTDSSDAADSSFATVKSAVSEDTPRMPSSHSGLAAALYKTPLNTGSRPSRFLKTPLPALTKGLLDASSPPSHAELPSPMPRMLAAPIDIPGSAMRGVVNTSTGQSLATPGPAEFARMFARPLRPKALNFAQILEDETEVEESLEHIDGDVTPQPLDSLSSESTTREAMGKLGPGPVRRTKSNASVALAQAGPSSPRKARDRPTSPEKRQTGAGAGLKRTSSVTDVKKPIERTSSRNSATLAPPPITKRRPSIPSANKKSREQPAASSSKQPAAQPEPPSSSSSSSLQPSGLSASDSSSTSTEPDTQTTVTASKPVSTRALGKTRSIPAVPAAAPTYDLEDEANLPSPFLKKVDRERFTAAASAPAPAVITRTKSSNKTSTNAAPPVLQPAPNITTNKTKAASVGAATGRRLSGANLLRVVAAKNATRVPSPSRSSEAPSTKSDSTATRPERQAVTNAKRAIEESRPRTQKV